MFFEAALAVLATVDVGVRGKRAVLARVALPSPALVSPLGERGRRALRLHMMADLCGLTLVLRGGGAVEVRDGCASSATRGASIFARAPYAVHFIASVLPMLETTAARCAPALSWRAGRSAVERRAARRTVLAGCRDVPSTDETAGYTLHPALLESMLQAINLRQAKVLGSHPTSQPPRAASTLLRAHGPRCSCRC